MSLLAWPDKPSQPRQPSQGQAGQTQFLTEIAQSRFVTGICIDSRESKRFTTCILQVRAFGKCSQASQGSQGQAGQTRFLIEMAPKHISITNLLSERISNEFTFFSTGNAELQCIRRMQASQLRQSGPKGRTRFLPEIALGLLGSGWVGLPWPCISQMHAPGKCKF